MRFWAAGKATALKNCARQAAQGRSRRGAGGIVEALGRFRRPERGGGGSRAGSHQARRAAAPEGGASALGQRAAASHGQQGHSTASPTLKRSKIKAAEASEGA